ncbi:MAG: SixA phosphatase family protein [Dermatophilaceae bacterium]
MTSAAHDKRLILVRHSKAEQNMAVDDHDRQLTEGGRRDARAVGAWLKAESIVCDLVICSTSVRTRQTWDEAVRGGAHTEFVEYRRGVYTGGPAGVLTSIRDDAGDLDTVLIVGHAPTMPAVASILSDGEGSAQAHQAMADGFPTSGIALLRYAGDWDGIGPGTAELERFHVARG